MRSGVRVRSQLLDIRHLVSASGAPRAAVVVAKFGFSAVARNTLKRRLRELVRAQLLPRIGSIDVLVRARREAYAGSFDELKAEVERAAAALGAGTRPS